jgi:hypothetical protein
VETHMRCSYRLAKPTMSAFYSKADIRWRSGHVANVPTTEVVSLRLSRFDVG